MEEDEGPPKHLKDNAEPVLKPEHAAQYHKAPPGHVGTRPTLDAPSLGGGAAPKFRPDQPPSPDSDGPTRPGVPHAPRPQPGDAAPKFKRDDPEASGEKSQDKSSEKSVEHDGKSWTPGFGVPPGLKHGPRR